MCSCTSWWKMQKRRLLCSYRNDKDSYSYAPFSFKWEHFSLDMKMIFFSFPCSYVQLLDQWHVSGIWCPLIFCHSLINHRDFLLCFFFPNMDFRRFSRCYGPWESNGLRVQSRKMETWILVLPCYHHIIWFLLSLTWKGSNSIVNTAHLLCYNS